jgi:hypothetical protein
LPHTTIRPNQDSQVDRSFVTFFPCQRRVLWKRIDPVVGGRVSASSSSTTCPARSSTCTAALGGTDSH